MENNGVFVVEKCFTGLIAKAIEYPIENDTQTINCRIFNGFFVPTAVVKIFLHWKSCYL